MTTITVDADNSLRRARFTRMGPASAAAWLLLSMLLSPLVLLGAALGLRGLRDLREEDGATGS